MKLLPTFITGYFSGNGENLRKRKHSDHLQNSSPTTPQKSRFYSFGEFCRRLIKREPIGPRNINEVPFSPIVQQEPQITPHQSSIDFRPKAKARRANSTVSPWLDRNGSAKNWKKLEISPQSSANNHSSPWEILGSKDFPMTSNAASQKVVTDDENSADDADDDVVMFTRYAQRFSPRSSSSRGAGNSKMMKFRENSSNDGDDDDDIVVIGEYRSPPAEAASSQSEDPKFLLDTLKVNRHFSSDDYWQPINTPLRLERTWQRKPNGSFKSTPLNHTETIGSVHHSSISRDAAKDDDGDDVCIIGEKVNDAGPSSIDIREKRDYRTLLETLTQGKHHYPSNYTTPLRAGFSCERLPDISYREPSSSDTVSSLDQQYRVAISRIEKVLGKKPSPPSESRKQDKNKEEFETPPASHLRARPPLHKSPSFSSVASLQLASERLWEQFNEFDQQFRAADRPALAVDRILGSHLLLSAERRRSAEKLEIESRLLREANAAKDRQLEEEIRLKLRLEGVPLPLPEEEDKDFLDLDPTQLETVDRAWDGKLSKEELFAEKFNLEVRRKDLQTLKGLSWLNDEIINFYMEMIKERSESLKNGPKCHIVNSFWYPKLVKNGFSAVRRWTRKFDIFDREMLLVPVHLGMHWCFAAVDFKQKQIRYYDSMGGQNWECLESLKKFLNEESLDKKKVAFDSSEWETICVEKIPQQQNGSDCGVFALKFADFVSRRKKINFDQSHMKYFRMRMVAEICEKRLFS